MLAWLNDHKTTLKWIITSAIRLVAGYFAVKFGKDAVGQQTWDAVADGLLAFVIALMSVYTSVSERKKLAEAQSTLEQPIKPDDPAQENKE